jgi:hypothetical protein
LSLQDLVGGKFCKNKPSLGFHGDSSPQVGYQGPTYWTNNIFLWRPKGHHKGPKISPIAQMIHLGGLKRHPLIVDAIIRAMELVV